MQLTFCGWTYNIDTTNLGVIADLLIKALKGSTSFCTRDTCVN